MNIGQQGFLVVASSIGGGEEFGGAGENTKRVKRWNGKGV
jgi:hypothetical protein